MLGSLPFDIDLCDFVFKDDSSDFASFANDTTIYECGPKLNEVSKNLYKKALMSQFQQLESKYF